MSTTLVQVTKKSVLGTILSIAALSSLNLESVLAVRPVGLETRTQFSQEDIKIDIAIDGNSVTDGSKQIAQRVTGGINLNVNIDPFSIAQAIADNATNTVNREGFVKGLLYSANYASRDNYNVLVFNLAQPHEGVLNDVIFFGTASTQGVTYGIWVFRGGEFRNKGDGTYANWAFGNSFDRSGSERKLVRFFSSSWSCHLRNGDQVGTLKIWWGDQQQDGTWACNQWNSNCNTGGGCVARARWVLPRRGAGRSMRVGFE
jgi:hypothetical protein